MVTAAEVYPFAAFEPFVKSRQHVIEGTLQYVGVLFAHGVEVNSVQSVKTILLHLFQRYPHAGAGNAGVIQIGFYFGIAGVDAHATGDTPWSVLYLFPILFPLSKRIEHNVVAQHQQLCEVFLGIGRGEHMYFLAEGFPSQFCLI